MSRLARLLLRFTLLSVSHRASRSAASQRPFQFVYYESLKRDLKTKTIYELRCDERLKTKFEESTRLAYTLLCAELEHLKIETRLTSETPVSEMGEYASVR